MRALVYEGPKSMRLRTVPVPKPGPHDVLLRVRSVGICGTDLHIYNGGTAVPTGTILGHEFSGDVVAIGRHVHSIKIGNRVVAEHVVNCRACYYCLRGKPNLCERAQVLGIDRAGALAQYVAVPERLVYPYPAALSYDEAALIEPLTIALYAAADIGFLLEKKVAVVGQGPIGILLDQVLQAAGAHVIGIDVLPHRLQFARRMGWVQTTINARSKQLAARLANVAPLGVDAAFEAVGKEVTAGLCIDLTRRDGRVYILGVFEAPTKLDLMRVVKKELHLHGSWTCSFSFPAAIDLVAERKIRLQPLITHRYALRDGARAFRDASAYGGKRMKTILRCTP